MGRVLLFTAKDRTASMFKALGLEYRGRVLFGEVRQSSSDIIIMMRTYKVTKLPTLVGISTDGTTQHHTGSLSHLSLSFFLSKFALPEGSELKNEL